MAGVGPKQSSADFVFLEKLCTNIIQRWAIRSTLDISSIHYLATSAAYIHKEGNKMKAMRIELVSTQLGEMTEAFVALLISTVPGKTKESCTSPSL